MCYAFMTVKQPHIKCLRVKIFRDCRGYTAAALYMDFFVVEEEYIDGLSLQEMIDGGEEMSEARARDIVSSICGTLADLHAIGIIHRDVKPEHMMLTPEGKVYLIDLDAAMQLAPEEKSDTQLLGTAVYAALEQYRSGDLAKIIAKCTEMNPGSRYQNASELLTELEHAVLSDQKTKRRRIYKIIAAACFVPLFLLGFIIFDSIYYPTVETEDFSMSDSACLVCTKEGNIYILYRNNAKRLELPVLDFYREKTGEKAKCRQRKMAPLKWAASSIISRR